MLIFSYQKMLGAFKHHLKLTRRKCETEKKLYIIQAGFKFKLCTILKFLKFEVNYKLGF